ncbi:MAG TPA: hypothetical protein VJS39_04405 [Gemmatimonadaceae bacterium]|nr:hypothetical protein [Gemmatimonadaceae bacterium]
MTLDRRRFLQLTALGVIGSVTETACARDNGSTLAHPELVEMLGADRVRELGERYRAATPGENSAEKLRDAISRGGGFHVVRTSIGDQINDDFKNGRTVVVDGWILSVTEARQAALFSLTRV